MKKRVKVLWLSSIACNGNAHSFLNYPQLEYFLSQFEFINHPIFESTYTLEEVVSKTIPCDILLLEGSLSPEIEKAGKNLFSIIQKYSEIIVKRQVLYLKLND